MPKRRQASLAGNPLLIGAVTTLLVVVAVYLSFNANNGLPFVPSYKLKAALPNADGLIKGNDVRIGGTRVGMVSNIKPHQEASGRSIAIVEMNLQKSVEPLPRDTATSVLSRSSIGLKYLELIKGTSPLALKPGSTIPLSAYREPVQLDEFFDMFDKKTRQASQENLINGGNGFAERGQNLNETFHALRPLTANLIPVMRNIAAPRTGFGELWRALDRPAEQTAPVAETNAAFFSELDTFFTAWASVYRSLERSIEGGPASLEQATYSLHHQARFYENSTEFMRLLHPTAVALRTAAPAFAGAESDAIATLPGVTGLNEGLERFLIHFRSFAENPVVSVALEELTRTAELGDTVVKGIAPAQTTCNYITLTFRNLANLFAESIGVGTLARVNAVLPPTGPNSQGGPSSAPAAGPSPDATLSGVYQPQYNDNFLHANPYPNVAGPGQPKICEAGNEVYPEPKELGEEGRTFIGHAARVSGTRTEVTKRKQNLFGETYPPATLSNLGISQHGSGGK
jgi:ABC-type transporter Mla subunit MlaD